MACTRYFKYVFGESDNATKSNCENAAPANRESQHFSVPQGSIRRAQWTNITDSKRRHKQACPRQVGTHRCWRGARPRTILRGRRGRNSWLLERWCSTNRGRPRVAPRHNTHDSHIVFTQPRERRRTNHDDKQGRVGQNDYEIQTTILKLQESGLGSKHRFMPDETPEQQIRCN